MQSNILTAFTPGGPGLQCACVNKRRRPPHAANQPHSRHRHHSTHMVFLHIVFMPSDAATWLSRGAREALNARYEAQYDVELACIEGFQQARLAIQHHIRSFLRAERGALFTEQTRVTIAPKCSVEPERPYTLVHLANDSVVPNQLLGPMAYEQVLRNARETHTVVVVVHVAAPCSGDDLRRVAVLQTAMLGTSAYTARAREVTPEADEDEDEVKPVFTLQSLSGIPELLRLIVLEALPLRGRAK
jgi:hypothetical protein